MKSFKRIFKYILPQWPRVIAVILSAMVVAVLLSMSFATVIPMLKVMMGEEGLHVWVDRKMSNHRYGVEIYLPGRLDYANKDLAHYLELTDVEPNSGAHISRLRRKDEIIAAGDSFTLPLDEKFSSDELLKILAEAPLDGQLKLLVRRFDEKAGTSEQIKLTLNPKSAERKAFESWAYNTKADMLDLLRKAVSLMPRATSKSDTAKTIVYIIIAMGVVTIIRCIAKFYQEYLAQKVVQNALMSLRDDAFGHILNMPVGFFADQRPSDTVSRFIRDAGEIGIGVKTLLGKALREPLNALCMLSIAMFINWQLTCLFLGAAPVIIGLLAVFGKKMKRATRKSLAAWSEMLAKLSQSLSGLRVVKVYNRADHERGLFRTINRKLLRQLLKIAKVDAATSPMMEVLGMVAGSAALIAGASWVQKGHMSGSEFFGLLLLLGSAAEAIRKASGVWNKIQSADAAAGRIFSVIDEPIEIQKPGATALATLHEKIEFRNVSFSYRQGSKPALNNINLVVQAGHNVAVVGPNGSGKTTLVNLLPRFYDVDSGEILIDGVNIADVTIDSLREQIGIVTQNVITFNDTIAANIAYGKGNATMEEIISAAKRSYAHEFIAPLPNGYETIIGEDGAGLSGGQLQRIVIARAILKNPPILIFDEAMSQIDADSETKIHAAIEKFMQNRTSFLIAHRFSTVITADVIVVINEGRIEAQGSHKELLDSCQLYRNLYQTQLIGS